MTIRECVGCLMIGFGPSVALFIVTIARSPLKVILLTASAFFWLISLLFSSILWFAVIPLRTYLAFSLVFSVLFQELMRFAFYQLMKKAELGLQKIALGSEVPSGPAAPVRSQAQVPLNTPPLDSISEPGAAPSSRLTTPMSSPTPPLLPPAPRLTALNSVTVSYVAGLGFGIMAGLFSLINMISYMAGPGSIGLYGESVNFFLLSALQGLFITMLHISWNVVTFTSLDKKQYVKVAIVIALHLLVSCLTLLNEISALGAELVSAFSFILVVVCAIWAFYSIGAKFSRFQFKLTADASTPAAAASEIQ